VRQCRYRWNWAQEGNVNLGPHGATLDIWGHRPTSCHRRDRRPVPLFFQGLESGNLRGTMEIRVTVTAGQEGLYRATFHPAPEVVANRSRDKNKAHSTPVQAGTSWVVPGLSISLPAAAASLPA
jgi:hypothetical protein